MRTYRVMLVLAVVSLLAGAAQLRAPKAQAAEACFEVTNQCIRGRFLDYWQAHGGLAINGFPLSDERRELLEDGNTYTVQYFERVRMEYHPELQPPNDVQLGQFGRRALQVGDGELFGGGDTAPAPPLPDTAYFPETGHNLGGRFLQYWLANGGLAQFGYPLTEEKSTQYLGGSPTYREYTIQYFERARFEYHPENPSPYDILLGQFGRRILTDANLLVDVPRLNRLYLTNVRVQRLLGRPSEPAIQAPGAYLAFERGAMIWRGDTRGVWVLCNGSPSAGTRVRGFGDTWQEGEDPGGGLGPGPGLFEPKRGFGKIWRENPEVRQCLGYATSPDETAYTLNQQRFYQPMSAKSLAWMVSAAAPEGRFIYVLSTSIPTPAQEIGYERFPDPLP